LNIKFFYDGINFRIIRSGGKKIFLEKVIADENKIPGDLVFIFTNDENILEINRKFLEHDYCTDIISFDYSEGNIVNGEIYVSIETVRRNAIELKVLKDEEIMRVIIHGVLHLCGYRDTKSNERKKMFLRQEKLLQEYKKLLK
jgi:rRNA maturation RNase YbeY